MASYILASYDIVDPEAYEAYPPAVGPLLQAHGAEILVADYGARALEGEAHGVYVVLRFESEEAAMAWYQDPAYEPVKKVRVDASANTNAVLAAGFVRPGD